MGLVFLFLFLFFKIHSATLCILIGAFSSFTFKVIIDRYCHFVNCLGVVFVVLFLLLLVLSSFVLFVCDLMSSLNIFAISTLNSLLGRLPISTLLNSSFGVLSYLFIWNMFLCCLILPHLLLLFLCIW